MWRAFFLAGILGGVISAQTQQARPQETQPQQPSFGFADSLVVTPSLEKVELEDVASSVTVIDREAIETRQATHILDLLRTVPGISVVQSGSAGNVTSVFSRGTSSTHTLVLWNGLVLNDPYFGGFDWAFLGTEGVERVEFVAGPSSVLYGSDGIGGTVQLLTGLQEDSRVGLEAGENGYGRASGAGSLGGEALRLDLVGAFRTEDGEIANDDYEAVDVVARGTWTPHEGLTLGLLARLDDSEIGIPRSGAGPTPRRRQDTRGFDLALPLQATLGIWNLDAQLSRVQADLEFRDPDSSFSVNDTESERLQARMVAAREASSGLRLSFGGEWKDAEVSNVSNFGTNLDGESQSTAATFSELRAGWERVTVTAAFRYDDHESFGSQTSPALGIVLRLGEESRLRASYGEGFRAPSLGELFFPFSGNPALEAETSESIELGLDQELGLWHLSLSLFENRLENLIDFDPVTFTNVNVGKARSRGVEARLGFTDGPWRVEANGTYLEAEDRISGEALLRRPEQTYNLLLTYSPGPWSFHLTARHVGDRPDLDPVTLAPRPNPSYERLDLAAHWQATKRLRPFARLDNAADADYEEAMGFPAPGRAFVGGVNLTF